MTSATRRRTRKPTCPVCGWETYDGHCGRLELHWTVCPTCRGCVDHGQTCTTCTTPADQPTTRDM